MFVGNKGFFYKTNGGTIYGSDDNINTNFVRMNNNNPFYNRGWAAYIDSALPKRRELTSMSTPAGNLDSTKAGTEGGWVQ